MRKAIFCALLFLVPVHAADATRHREWLEFRKAFAAELGGPTGIYAIQDMLELNAGETAYLPSGEATALRWTRSTGPAGRIEALSLRLFNPETRQWSLNFANATGGVMAEPTLGGFSNGRGEFYNLETFDGREVLVRFVISDITRDSCRFEQAFSTDGGKTWEANWIAVDTRVK